MSSERDFSGATNVGRNPFALAGGLSICVAALTAPSAVLHVVIDAGKGGALMAASGVLDGLILVLGIYVLMRVRSWLEEVHGTRDLHGVILATMVGMAVAMPMAVVGRVLGASSSLAFMVPMLLLIAALAVIGIVFGVRFLRVEGDMRGLKKPIAYFAIARALCWLSFFLVPFGILMGIVVDVLLGLALLQSEDAEVDYV